MNLRNWDRDSFLRYFTWPVIDAPWRTKTLFARSTPAVWGGRRHPISRHSSLNVVRTYKPRLLSLFPSASALCDKWPLNATSGPLYRSAFLRDYMLGQTGSRSDQRNL